MLVTAMLARNEKDRYLERVLARCATFSDSILLLDDDSTDGTPDLARSMGCEVRTRGVQSPMWGQEYAARAELWDWAAEVTAFSQGWVLFCDADMLLDGDPRPYTYSWAVNAWAFILWDLWDSEQTARVDGFWQGHLHPRPWLIRPSGVPKGWKPEWSTRGLHTGHIPPNFPLHSGFAQDLSWAHLAYLNPEDRVKKHAAYLAKADQLTEYERAHAQSILDP